MKSSSLRVAIALIVGCSFGVLPKTTLAQDAPPRTGIIQPATTPLPNSVYEVVYAASSTSNLSETIVSIGNPSTTTCQVQVEWDYGTDGSVAGYSGPYNLSPRATLEFTTANTGESVKPFTLNVFRDTTQNFEGKARIRTNCPTTTKFSVNAVVAVGSSYIPIKVIKPTGNVGD